jgi:hypothetical protein
MGAARAIRLSSKAERRFARLRRAAGVILVVLSPQLVAAQTSRFALDVVAAADVDYGSQVTRKSTAWFDVFGAVRIADNFDLRVRPVVFPARSMVRGKRKCTNWRCATSGRERLAFASTPGNLRHRSG